MPLGMFSIKAVREVILTFFFSGEVTHYQCRELFSWHLKDHWWWPVWWWSRISASHSLHMVPCILHDSLSYFCKYSEGTLRSQSNTLVYLYAGHDLKDLKVTCGCGQCYAWQIQVLSFPIAWYCLIQVNLFSASSLYIRQACFRCSGTLNVIVTQMWCSLPCAILCSFMFLKETKKMNTIWVSQE